ncbi:MAG TPA: ribulokinase [Firmicutes bacterium]|jgi:L-ribulokinase|nr:ribulokinase [Bacillota bacterium]
MKYSIGIDYGTQSARAVLVEIGSGKVMASTEQFYPHGVMENELPSGKKLGADWAIQVGYDYYMMLVAAVKDLIKESRVDPILIIGIGIDTTSCTILPLDDQFEPLNEQNAFKDNPHAYVKMWKHHAAQGQANLLTKMAEKENMSFLKRYGGKISSEWMLPKIMQVLDEAPEVYDAAARFMEVGDWLVYKLTDNLVKSNVMTGYKALWSVSEGYPDAGFFRLLHPKLKNVITEKLDIPILNVGNNAGCLVEKVAKEMGLTEQTAVAVAHTDACVVPAAIGMNKAGQMVMSIGTSTCHLLLGDEEKIVPGMCGVVQDGTLPGFISYEAGQASVGDVFHWFVQTCINSEFQKEASDKGIDVYQFLEEKAQQLKVGQNGLIALDWFNGNRTVLVDADLSGMILGLNLHTTPEEIYRALIEATAFGTRKIIKTYESYGVPVNELFACGGIATKSPLIMQIYADVCNKDIHVSNLPQTSAYASAIYGATAAGVSRGGYGKVADAAAVMGNHQKKTYSPNPANTRIYDTLFSIYEEMHDFMGIQSNAMKKLKEIRNEVGGGT